LPKDSGVRGQLGGLGNPRSCISVEKRESKHVFFKEGKTQNQDQTKTKLTTLKVGVGLGEGGFVA